jgi:hypothetical protein
MNGCDLIIKSTREDTNNFIVNIRPCCRNKPPAQPFLVGKNVLAKPVVAIEDFNTI